MTDDGSPLEWHGLDEAGLRTYAAEHVGLATDEMSHPDRYDWTLEHLPLDTFDALPVDWKRWHAEEVAPNPRCAWMRGDVEVHTPIVLSIEAGQPTIWDGWHRIAFTRTRGDETIVAIVGRSAPESPN